jgi:hypothetical protein
MRLLPLIAIWALLATGPALTFQDDSQEYCNTTALQTDPRSTGLPTRLIATIGTRLPSAATGRIATATIIAARVRNMVGWRSGRIDVRYTSGALSFLTLGCLDYHSRWVLQ